MFKEDDGKARLMYQIIGTNGTVEGCAKFQAQDLCRCCAGHGRLMLFPGEERVLSRTEMKGLKFASMESPNGIAGIVECTRDYMVCDETGLKPLDCMTYPFTPMQARVADDSGGYEVDLVLSDNCHVINDSEFMLTQFHPDSFMARVCNFAVYLNLVYPDQREIVKWAAIAGKRDKPFKIMTVLWPGMEYLREVGVEDARELGKSILEPYYYSRATKSTG